MLEAIAPNIQGSRTIEYPITSGFPHQRKEQVQEEFMAIFYKELLKQVFKPPNLGLPEENRSAAAAFGSDLLIEKLALELAKSGAFSAKNIFPADLTNK